MKAIREALSWLKKQPWLKDILESGSFMVIQAIRSQVPIGYNKL